MGNEGKVKREREEEEDGKGRGIDGDGNREEGAGHWSVGNQNERKMEERRREM